MRENDRKWKKMPQKAAPLKKMKENASKKMQRKWRNLIPKEKEA